MIPIRLTIEGLFSYQEAQTVDFTRLCEPRLFGIFGAVGSGKSSILEAIMFALYNKTDRLPRDNQNYNMMNLRSDRMRIEFEFEISEGERYFFTVEGKRSGKDFDKVSTFQRHAYRMEAGGWVPLEKHTAEDLLGLSYDNFRRTIIIPQGKFQEFLQLGDKDRTAMMKEIFQLDRFELWPAAAQLESENKEALDILSGKLSAVEELTEEIIETRKKAALELEARKVRQSELVKGSEALRADWKERMQYHTRMQREQDALRALQVRDEEFRKRRERLEKFERVRREFAVPLDRLRKLDGELLQEQNNLARITDEHGRLRVLLDKLNQDITQLSKSQEEEKQEALIIDDLRRLGEMRAFDERLKTLSARRNELGERLKGILDKLGPGSGKKEELEKELAILREQIGDVPAMASWIAGIERWQEEGNRLKSQRRDLEQKFSKWSQGIIAIPLPNNMSFSEADKVHEVVTEELRVAEKTYTDAHQAWLDGSSREHIREIRKQLKEGEPCPVCGSVHHPSQASEEQLPGEDLSQKLRIADNDRKAWQEAYRRLMELWSDGKSLRDQMDILKEKLNDTARSYIDAKMTYPGKGGPPPEDKDLFREFLQQQADALKSTSDLTKELAGIQAQEKTVEEDRKHAELELAELDKEILKAETARDTIRASLSILTGEEEWVSGQDPGRLASEREKANNERSRTLDNLRKEKEQQERTWLGLDKEIGIIRTRIEATDKERTILVRETENLLEAHGEDSLDEVMKILELGIDSDRERQELEAHFTEMSRVTANVKEFTQWLEKRPYNAEQHQTIEKEWEAAQKELEEILQKEAEYRTELKRLTEDLERKGQLLAEKERLEIRGDNIRTLKNLFRSSGFVQYISRVYLENICNAANARFITLTRRQLALQLNDKDEFEVVDYLNEGKTRSVRTLSGGQTFQASLCLALALAESVQTQARSKQNFFFLDEGFGSLDRESLQTVFETLKSLRKEHRIVGIISHVEDLQQEIQSYVRITMDQEKGSKVRYSWE